MSMVRHMQRKLGDFYKREFMHTLQIKYCKCFLYTDLFLARLFHVFLLKRIAHVYVERQCG